MADPNNLLTPEGVGFNFICKAGNTTIKRMVVQKHIEKSQWNAAYSAPHVYFKYCDKDRLIKDSKYLVGFCRNPYARLVSCWKDKVNKKLHSGFARRYPQITQKTTLDEFINFVYNTPDEKAEQHFRSQTWDLAPMEDIDCLLRLENISECWQKARRDIIDLVGVDYGELQHHNKSKNKTPELTIKQRQKIRIRFERDFEVLGYEY